MSLMVTTGGLGVDTEVAQKAADDLSRIGVKVTIETEPMAQYLQHLSRAGFPTDAFSSAWPSDPNIDAIRPLRIHSCLRREPFYCDTSIMPKIEAALTALDPAEALTLRHELMAFYHEQAPGIYFYEGTLFVGLAPRVRDFASAFNMIAYDKVWLED
jgi:ABC-type transport system substrate-binding protein